MSYDLEILVKIESGDYICIAEPKYSSPTYNLGRMLYLKGLLSGYAWTEDEEIIGNVYENPELLEDK